MSKHHHLFLCTGSTCAQQGAEESLQYLRGQLQEKNVKNVRLTLCRCLGQCGNGPNAVIYGSATSPEAVWYGRLVEGEIDLLISKHLLRGDILSHLVFTPADDPSGDGER